MLVLSRRSNESIVIGGEVIVTVLEIKGDQVRLGIRAPRHVTIHREEIHAEIQRENETQMRMIVTGALQWASQ